MTNEVLIVALSMDEVRAITRYAVACARPALTIFENERPGDLRPRAAIDAGQAFADGADRTKYTRDRAWAALRASTEARDEGMLAASEAAYAAMAAAGAAYLHPLAKSTQVKHILGAAAHTARAFEHFAGDVAGGIHMEEAQSLADPIVVDVLRRYPSAPAGGGRVGELIRQLDVSLRLKLIPAR